jgi:membrane protease YdiL (CAAX protease family)
MAPRTSSHDLTAAPPEPEQHGAVRSILLHLVPGAVAVLVYLLVCAPLAAALGLPRQLAVVLYVAVSIVGLQLATLFFLGWRRNGRLALDGVVLNRRKLPGGELAGLVLALFLWAVLVIALLSGIDELLLERVFYWVPDALLPERDVAVYPAAVLVGTHLTSVVVIGVAAPIAEELYFRGYLLPRVSRLGGWAPVWNAVLFNAYHLWSPWRIVTRTLFSLPMVYAVWRKRSISIGIWWHCLGNVAGEVLALAAVLRALDAG